jgi:hypothetical protein
MSFRLYTPQDFKGLKRIAIDKWGDRATWEEEELQTSLTEMYEDESMGLHPVFEYRYVLNRLREAKEMLGGIRKKGELTDLFGTMCASKTIWTTQSIGSELERLKPLTTEDYLQVYLSNLENLTNQDYMIWNISRLGKGEDLEAKRTIFDDLREYRRKQGQDEIVNISWGDLIKFAKGKLSRD